MIDFIEGNFSSTEFNQINLLDYKKLSYLCSYQDDRYYCFQKLFKSQTINRKWFYISISDEPELNSNNPIIVLKILLDAIYDKENNILYFQKLTSITSIFSRIENLYREATKEDTVTFLQNDFINLVKDYGVEKVNRQRIAMTMDTFNSFTDTQRNSIYDYIKKYCGDLEFSDKNKSFDIGTEKNLKQLMFGIEQRYYTTLIGDERRLANSITAI